MPIFKTPAQVRKRRWYIEDQIKKCESEIRSWKFELQTLQQLECTHKNTRRHEMSGMATETCEDCGLQRTDHALREKIL